MTPTMALLTDYAGCCSDCDDTVRRLARQAIVDPIGAGAAVELAMLTAGGGDQLAELLVLLGRADPYRAGELLAPTLLAAVEGWQDAAAAAAGDIGRAESGPPR